MSAEYLELAYWQVAVASLLIVVNGGISIVLRLGMERTLAIASLRTVLQLALVGMVLEWVFRVDHWAVVTVLLCVMTSVAAITAAQRNRRRYPGIWWDTLVSIWASSWLVTGFTLMVVLHGIDKWYQPQYAIPLLGMVLGNTLNGISLGQNTLTEALVNQRERIEGLLAIGATRWEAVCGPVQTAVRTGTTPIINSMMVVGLVSLPGMMTGQILTGAKPIEAVKYQIVIMFLVASATALGTVGVTVFGFLRLFNRDHQFLYSRLS